MKQKNEKHDKHHTSLCTTLASDPKTYLHVWQSNGVVIMSWSEIVWLSTQKFCYRWPYRMWAKGGNPSNWGKIVGMGIVKLTHTATAISQTIIKQCFTHKATTQGIFFINSTTTTTRKEYNRFDLQVLVQLIIALIAYLPRYMYSTTNTLITSYNQ